MANFFVEGRGTTAVNFVKVSIGQTAMVGCWGANINGTFLTVTCNDPSIASVASGGSKSADGMIRSIGIKGLRAGNVMLEARLGPRGPVWAFTQVVVAAAGASATSAFDDAFDNAVRTKQLVFNNPADLRLVNDISAGKETSVRIGPELQGLLAILAKSGKVVVMSLYRRGQGPHGMVQPDGAVICRGVDITGYAGVPITLTNRSFAIDAVTNLISHFPPGRFDLGFPRPVGGNGPMNFDPTLDVFFSVPDKAAADLCYLGKAVHPLNAMLEPARSRVQQAMTKSGAKFPVLFADGLNHLHVKAY